MAKFYLINTTQVGSTKYFAGDEIDDASDPKADIEAAGGVCWSQDSIVAAQAAVVQKLRATKAINEAACDALMLAAAAAQAKALPDGFNLQAGTATLAAGTVTVTGVTLTANSRIILTMKDPGAGAITGFADLDAPAANRNTSTGQFVVNAIDASKATIATAVCTFDWLIVG